MQISVDVDVDIDDIIDNCGAKEVLKRIDIDDIIKFINSHDAEDLADSIISDDAARTLLEAIKTYHKDYHENF